jgi:hypothetical protein
VADIEPLNRRLKGLEEFDAPEFVGRTARIERKRQLIWFALFGGAVMVGTAIGLFVL